MVKMMADMLNGNVQEEPLDIRHHKVEDRFIHVVFIIAFIDIHQKSIIRPHIILKVVLEGFDTTMNVQDVVLIHCIKIETSVFKCD